MDSQAEGIKVAVVGMSVGANCGVRDHAARLAEVLPGENVSCSFHWLQRRERSLRGSSAEIRAWRRALTRELQERRPDAILLHYSVFTYSHKGIPIFVPPVFSTVRAAGIPVVSILHEFAYPWAYGGWRGTLWAASQRALLVEVMRSCAAGIVTTDSRASWLASRVWLPARRVLVAPVFSNLPPPVASHTTNGGAPVLGLFGYSYQGAAFALTLDALSDLRSHGLAAQLRLVGGPGPTSSAGRMWLAEARARDLEGALSFTGALDPQALSDALVDCEVLLCADAGGPSQRKGTLAASLASGRPVVAIDGPLTWAELIRSAALSLSDATPRALAAEIESLLLDPDAQDALGARGRAFSERQMGVERTARATRKLLDELLGAGRS